MTTMGEALVGRVVETIASHGVNRVLVAGHRGDNFPPAYRDHPQLLFWETDKSPHHIAERLPVDVKLVLTTRFIGHPMYEALAKACAERNVVFGVKNFGTGEIKALLQPFMNGHATTDDAKETDVAKATTVTDGTKKVKGWLTAFVKQHVDWSVEPAKDARRILALALAEGVATTANSIAQCIYKMKSDAVKAVAQQATRSLTTRPVTSMDDDDSTIIQMLDDMTAAVALVRQEVMKRSEKRHQLKELLKSL
jgi:hypothetical protein